ncbi:MAG: peptidylprolyl isomerase [Betaproteobacteria bacterium]|nr:peptidylprolyl isomerase [Betaproteobacteria bacterium]MBI2508734.1 peptidylprolyl isomerase [Betaproteobacteria bacterium]
MKSTAIALLLGLAAATAAHAQNGVARVNGVVIPQSRMDMFVRDLTAQGRPDTPELRTAIKQELVNRELVTQEAARRGLEKNPEVQAQLEIARQTVLFRAYLQDVMRTVVVTEDAAKKEYERMKGQLGTREYKARHILVEKEDEARDIIARIKKGASFEKLAGEKSKDTGTKARGGELDWNRPDSVVKPFGDALVRLKKGQMTDAPVQTQFGWHVIRLDDERALKVPGYDEVKGNIHQQLQQQQQKQVYEKVLNDLRAKAKIEDK